MHFREHGKDPPEYGMAIFSTSDLDFLFVDAGIAKVQLAA
jgi:hypothetical protein